MQWVKLHYLRLVSRMDGGAGMWDAIQLDRVFRSWPLKDSEIAGGTLSSRTYCVEFLTDAFIARCDYSTKSVFFVFTVHSSQMTG